MDDGRTSLNGLSLVKWGTLPETNSLPLKIGAPWKRRFRAWKPPFLGATR